MEELNYLNKTLEDVLSKLQCDKITIRRKAIEELSDLIRENEENLIDLLSGSSNQSTINWLQLFETICEAINSFMEKESTTSKGLNSLDIQSIRSLECLVREVTAIANKQDQPCIKLTKLAAYAIHFFNCPQGRQYMGTCFATICIDIAGKGVSYYSNFKLQNWLSLLDSLQSIIVTDGYQTKPIYLHCCTKIIQAIGNVYYSGDKLFGFFEVVSKIFMAIKLEDSHRDKIEEQIVLMKEIINNIVAVYPIEVKDFLYDNLYKFINRCNFIYDDDVKSSLFELLNLYISLSDIIDGDKIENSAQKKLYSDLFQLAETEISNHCQSSGYTDGESKFVNFEKITMAAVTYVKIHDKIIIDNDEKEQLAKRRKLSSEESIYDLINIGDHNVNYHWFEVLNQILKLRLIGLKQEHEFSTMESILLYLKLFRLVIRHVKELHQMNIFSEALIGLLKLQQKINTADSDISIKCSINHLWLEIMDYFLQTHMVQKNMIKLVQLMLKEIILIGNFITSHFIVKLISKHLNHKELITREFLEILQLIWSTKRYKIDKEYQEETVYTLLKYYLYDDSLDPEQLGLTVATILTVGSKVVSNIICEGNVQSYALNELINIHQMNNFIVQNSMFDIQQLTNNDRLPSIGDLKCAFRNDWINILEKSLFSEDILNDLLETEEKILFILSRIEITIYILNGLIRLQCIDDTRFKESVLVKKLKLYLSELKCELESKPDTIGINELLVKFNTLFNPSLHKLIRDIIKEFSYVSYFEYIKESLKKTRPAINNKLDVTKMTIKYLLATHDENDVPLSIIHSFDYINAKLEDSFNLIKIVIGSRIKHDDLLQWTVQCIIDLSKKNKLKYEFISFLVHNLHLISESLIQLEELDIECMNSIVNSLFKICELNSYRSRLMIPLLQNFKIYVKVFITYFDESAINSFMKQLIRILNVSAIEINLIVIQTITYFLNKIWLINSVEQSFKLTKAFNNEFKATLTQLTFDADEDLKNWTFLLRINLMLSLFCVSDDVRQNALLDIAKIIKIIKLPKDKMAKLINHLMNYFGNKWNLVRMETVHSLIGFSIENGIDLEFSFLYFGEPNENEFLRKNAEIIQFIDTKINGRLKGNENEEVIAKYLVWNLLNVVTNSSLTPDNKKKLTNYNLKNHPLVLKYLTNILRDDEYMVKLFGVQIDYVDSTNEFITVKQYKEALDIYRELSISSQNVIQQLLHDNPCELILVLVAMKEGYYNSYTQFVKFRKIFQYCVLYEEILNFITSEASWTNDILKYLVLDLTTFMCNVIKDNDEECDLKIGIINFSYKQFFGIITGGKYNYFYIHFNTIISALVLVMQASDSNQLCISAEKLLQLFIIDNTESFKYSIQLLDDFPDGILFDEVKKTVKHIKSTQFDLSLEAEIEAFLQIENRSLESIKIMKNKLSSKKNELIQLNDVKVYKKFLRYMIQIIQSIETDELNRKRSIEAANCLAELGTGHLSELMIPENENKSYTMDYSSDISQFLEIIYKEMYNLLMSPNIELVKEIINIARVLESSNEIESVEKNDIFSIFRSYSTTPPSDMFITNSSVIDLKQYFLPKTITDWSYDRWLTSVTKYLLTIFQLDFLHRIVEMSLSITEAIFIQLISLLQSSKIKDFDNELMIFVATFFHNFANAKAKKTIVELYLNKRLIKLMLSVVESIRLYNLHHRINQKIVLIDLEYFLIAEAASYCNAPYSAILYTELWALEAQNNGEKRMTLSQISADRKVQLLMQEVYADIGCREGMEVFLNPFLDSHLYNQFTNNVERRLCELDGSLGVIDLENNVDETTYVLLDMGLLNIENKIRDKNSRPNYESLWKMCDWSHVADDEVIDDPLIGFEACHYSALKCYNSEYKFGTVKNIDSAKEYLITAMKNSSLQSAYNLSEYLLNFQLLHQIEDFNTVQYFFESNDVDCVSKIFRKWKCMENLTDNFDCLERLLAQRLIMIKSLRVRAKRRIEAAEGITDIEPNILLQLISEARSAGRISIALRYLREVKEITKNTSSAEIKGSIIIEDSKLWMLKGNDTMAKLQLTEFKSKVYNGTKCQIDGLRLLGEQLVEVGKISALLNEIIQQLEKQKNTNNLEVIQMKINIYSTLANFHLLEYNRLNDEINSEDFRKKKEITQSTVIDKPSKSSVDAKLIFLQRSINIDKQEILEKEQSLNNFLLKTMQYILTIIYLADHPDTKFLFNMVTLWFDNQSNKEILDLLDNRLSEISSYKFIPVMPQITPRINTTHKRSGEIAIKLIERCCMEHPHHVLPQLYCLKHAYVVSKNSTGNSDDRSIRADQIIKKVREKGTNALKSIIDNSKMVYLELITLANKEKATKIESLNQCKNLDNILIPTIQLVVSKTGEYPNIIGISHWDESIRNVGGINAPKKIICHGTDGRHYSQLLKGKDDLRQDTVLQQVFSNINTILLKDKEAKKRKLKIRTYKIVPLSKTSGILEFCENTTTFSEYLIPAHKKYRPNDMKDADCVNKMKASKSESIKTRVQVFYDIIGKVKPVFQYYFFEKYSDPLLWFERRVTYTNSTATASMVGYILGIGDRHLNNILIDQLTAEVVHIDFGIAFEYNKILPTPERVPFRLTRDITAPFGCSGVNGVFMKSCEITLELIRDNKSTILSILENLLYDPLCNWDTNFSKIQKNERREIRDVEPKNVSAERVLRRLKAKLCGADEANSYAIDVKSQVKNLIRDATNPMNIGLHYCGWRPYY